MAAKSSRVSVSLAPAAIATLNQIWNWNVKTYGVERANQYILYLKSETAKLATGYGWGKQIPSRTNLRYITIRRRRGGHGHVAVYELTDQTVYVLDYFHTAQNWQDRFKPTSLER